MTRRRFVYIDGEAHEVGADYVAEPRSPFPHVRGDLPDFVSPIDGKTYSGRAGLREHCKLHDVVPTADLKGLPPKQAVQPYTPDKAAIRDTIIQTMRQKGYMR
jgi:hypothetical protein